MVDVISASDLATHLGNADLETDPRLVQIVTLTNGLITEKWRNPADPVPVSVQLLGLAVGARAWRATPATGQLESITRSVDDASRTERYVVERGNLDGHHVYITEAELAALNGGDPRLRQRTGSIRLKVPGYQP